MQSSKKQTRAVPRYSQYKKPGKSLTEQSHARACDINTIMASYEKTGVIEHIKNYEPTFGDVSDLDFKKAMDTVAAVKSEFHDLPAYVRAHYNQDERAYLEAVSTPEGIADLRNLQPPSTAYKKGGERDTEALRASQGLGSPKEEPKEAPKEQKETEKPVT